ncbi:MAG: DinB family protein [Candidatus Sulfotelmatobacter sp.]
MAISEGVLQEFDLEMASTRRTLERIPEDKLTWKPHEKSMLLGRLAGHLAELPGFGATALTTESFDLASRPTNQKPLVAESQKHVLAEFDKSVARARAAIAATGDEEWNKNWMLSLGERKIYQGTRIGAVRRMMLNHIIHHRAQLGVYLRLNNVPVPSIYGPSADEGLK